MKMKLSTPWYCALLVLHMVKPSQQENAEITGSTSQQVHAETSIEILSNSIQLLTSLFQEKFTQIDTSLANLDSRLTDVDSKLTYLDSEFVKMNARLELESIKSNSNLLGMNSTLVEVKDDLVLVKEYVQSVEGGLATLSEKASRSLQLTEITKSLDDQRYIEDKVIKDNISENIQTIKEKVINLDQKPTNVCSNGAEEVNNQAGSLLKVIKQTRDSLKTHLKEITTKEDGWRETIDEIISLGRNSSDDMKWAIQEANLCNTAINSLISGNFKMSNTLDNINNNINKFADGKILLLATSGEISAFIGQDVSLDCGIQGEYDSCYWEQGDSIYKVDDIYLGYHSGFAATRATSIHDNPCGITITPVRWQHEGEWTCKAQTTSGHLLSATKILTLKNFPYGFEDYNGRKLLITKLSDGRMTYAESVDRCRMMNAKPFIPKNQKEFNLIVRVKRNLNNGDIWVPINDITNEGYLKWTNGVDASRSAGLKWCNGKRIHMNTDIYDCAIVGYSGCLDSIRMINCSWKAFPMICEI